MNTIYQTLLILTISLATLNTAATAQDLAGIKCVVNGDHQANAEASLDYKDGKLYFCCDDCVAAFKSEMKNDTNKYATKANHQLAVTGQYTQTGCPMSGGPAKDAVTSLVGGVEVGFCCNGCKSKVDAAATLAEKAELVFSDAAFEKGFALKEQGIDFTDVQCVVQPKPAQEKFSADYAGHKVYFCCNGCKSKFEKDATAFATAANHQLVRTGQVSQVACPISGKDLVNDQSSEVAGVEVKFCCNQCKQQVDAASGDAQLELVFGPAAFEKGFQNEAEETAEKLEDEGE